MPDFDFNDLVGEELDFYGVDGNCFKLDETVYEAIEDEDDGYRSMLDCVEINEAAKDSKIFFRTPVSRVLVEKIDEYCKDLDGSLDDWLRGYKLVDLHDGHCWLRFGTANYDDYYPYFVFDYTPKPVSD